MAKHRTSEVWAPPRFDPEARKAGLTGCYDKADIRAIQAFAQGNASETDQKLALDWIINCAAATYEEPFRPGSHDVVDYMLGRISVGRAIVKLMKIKPEIFDND